MSGQPTLIRHAHPGGFSLELPSDWDVAVAQPELAALVARAPQGDSGYSAALVVDVRDVPEPTTVEQFEAEQQEGMAAQLASYQCLEISRSEIGGVPGLYHLCNYISDSQSLTGSQWTAFVGQAMVMVSGIVRTTEYPGLAATFDDAVASFRWKRRVG